MSFTSQRFHWVHRGGAQTAQCDHYDRDGEDGQQRQGEDPPVQRRTIGEALQIAVHDEDADGHGDREADQHNFHETGVEHCQYLSFGSTVDPSDANFLAAVLRLEHHKAEHTHQ